MTTIGSFLKKILRDRRAKLVFFTSIFCNFMGACLEGISYSFMIVAFYLLDGKEALLPDFFFIKGSFLLFVSLAILSQFFKSGSCFLASLMNAKLGRDVQSSMQKRLYENILHLNLGALSFYKKGELVEILRAPFSLVRPFLEHLNHVIVSCFLIFISLTLMAILSPALTGVTFFLLILGLVVQRKIIQKSKESALKMTDHLEMMNVTTLEGLNGLKTIHLYNCKQESLGKMIPLFQELAKKTQRLLLAHASILSLNEIFGIVMVGASLIAGYLALSWEAKPLLAILLAFMTMTYRLSGKVIGGMSSLHQLLALSGHLRCLEKFPKAFEPEQKDSLCFQSTIAFESVSFHYSGAPHLSIDHLSFEIPKGSFLAIVGASGAGKSTLIDLLTGLYLPTSGKIMIDGIPLTPNTLFSWRESIGVVSQETFLFDGTIEENIALGKKGATLKEVEQAAIEASAHEFIASLALGYQTLIGEGANLLSGGERQRIALARALIRNPDILILDEPTSQIDQESETIIKETLLKYRGSKTIILTSHRFSTLKHADLILVIEKGKLVEWGRKQVLKEKKGYYANLWNLQST